jgi:hypothetical protein
MEVELPDGTIVEFPEGTPPETIKGVLAKRFGGTSALAEEAPQYAPNGVPMNDAAKREIIAKAKGGTLEVSQSRADTAKAFDNVAQVQMDNAPTAFGTFAGNLAPGLTFGFADEIAGGIDAALTDRTYGESVDMLRQREAEMAAANPKSAIAGQVVGAVASPASKFFVPGRGASLGGTVARAAGAGAAAGGVYGFGTGEGGLGNRAENALRGAVGGAVIGGAIPAVGNLVQRGVEGIVNSRTARAAMAAAPSVDDLRAAASRLYAQADNVTNLPRADFATQAAGTLDDAARSGMDDMLTPGAARVAGKMDEAAQSADPNIGFRELDILRKQAGVPAGNVANRTEAAIGSKMVAGIDDYIDSVDPALSGSLREARDMWGQLRRSELVDAAIDRAKNAASGFENGLRVEFRRIINNPKLARGFNEAEIKAMKQVVQGTAMGNVMRQLGRIGLGLSGQSNGLGATIGGIAGTAAAGPIGGAAAVGFGTAMKALAERSTRKAADGALSMVTARNALAGLPQASFPGIENALSIGGRAALPQGAVPFGGLLTGR